MKDEMRKETEGSIWTFYYTSRYLPAGSMESARLMVCLQKIYKIPSRDIVMLGNMLLAVEKRSRLARCLTRIH